MEAWEKLINNEISNSPELLNLHLLIIVYNVRSLTFRTFNSMSTAEIFWNLVFSIIVVVSVIGNVIVIWIICGESLSEFPEINIQNSLIICHWDWLETDQVVFVICESPCCLDKTSSEGVCVCIVVQNFNFLFKISCTVKSMRRISKAWHKYILTRKILSHLRRKWTLSVIMTMSQSYLIHKAF